MTLKGTCTPDSRICKGIHGRVVINGSTVAIELQRVILVIINVDDQAVIID
jgi:hypothetical protein